MALSVPDRIQTILDELGIDQVELGRIAGASKSVVNQWLSGKIKSVAAEYAFNLQRKKGYSAEWIMLGTGPAKLTADEDAKIGSKGQIVADWARLPPAMQYHLGVAARRMRFAAEAVAQSDTLSKLFATFQAENYESWEGYMNEFIGERAPEVITDHYSGPNRRQNDTGPKDGVEQRKREYHNHGLVHGAQVASHLTHKPQKKTRGAA